MKIIKYHLAFALCAIGVLASIPSQAQSNPMENVGVQHNQYAKAVMQSITSLPSEAGLESFVLNKVRQAMGNNSIQSSVNFRSSDPFQELSTEGFSPVFIQEADKVSSLASQRLSVAQFWVNLATLQSEAVSRLSGSEVDYYYVFTAVAKHSYKFWAPTSVGGEDGLKYLGVPNNIGPTIFNDPVFISIWKADAAGALIGGAIGNLPGLVGGAVFGSVGASIWNSWD